jgi:hypothetical protein
MDKLNREVNRIVQLAFFCFLEIISVASHRNLSLHTAILTEHHCIVLDITIDVYRDFFEAYAFR